MRSHLDFRLERKNFDDVRGTFEGFASVYGVTDLQGDIVEPGAFAKTIGERPMVKVLFNHDPNKPLGIGRLSDSPRGLFIKAELNLESALGAEVYSHLRKGVLDAMSIGYEVVKQIREGSVRRLKELRLVEVSVVTFPANQLARVVDVKNEAGETAEVLSLMREVTERMRADILAIHTRQLARDVSVSAASLKARR